MRCPTFPLGRHKACCVAVRLLMSPVKNRTDHFHGIRLNTCSSSPGAHEAFLPISPAPQCIPRGQLDRVGTRRVTQWYVSSSPPPNRTGGRVGHQRVALTGTFPMAPLQTARESFDLKQLSSGLLRAPLAQ